MGRFWVEWDLPADRDVDTFWRLSIGPNLVNSATPHNVEVRSSFQYKRTCNQNKYGILESKSFGGGYPATSTSQYFVTTGDLCMAVTVMTIGSSAWGFTHGYTWDAPISNSDWPNSSSNRGYPFLSVWLR